MVILAFQLKKQNQKKTLRRMNSIKLANILLIVVLVITVGSVAVNLLTKKAVTTNEAGESEITTKFVGFGGQKAA